MSDTAKELVARSHRLGSDPRVTNYAGGNTSAKGTETDPVTGEPVELLYVKGSGGDLGTLTESGLAVLRMDRLRALVNVYPGVDREDEMVAAFDYALHGKGGAAPSIDTAMHGLVDAAHVDHLHPDSGIAFATAKDGEKLTKKAFGDKVVWVPWRRPGFQLGLDIAEIKKQNPQAVGCILGGHGITAWGETSEDAEAHSLWIIDTAAAYIAEHGKADPFGGVRAGFAALPEADRHARAAALAPTIRGLASTDKPMVGHFTDTDVVLDFLQDFSIFEASQSAAGSLNKLLARYTHAVPTPDGDGVLRSLRGLFPWLTSLRLALWALSALAYLSGTLNANPVALTAIAALGHAAKAIGEDDEYDRIRQMLSDADPDSVSQLLD